MYLFKEEFEIYIDLYAYIHIGVALSQRPLATAYKTIK